jgi:sec-independent protein translocase protein TatC
VFLLGILCFIFYGPILTWLQHPYCHIQPHDCTFLATGPLDGLTLRIRIAFFGGIIAGSPVLFYQTFRFVMPGLKRNEKKYVVPFVGASLIFFLAGCGSAFFSFEHALEFLKSIGGKDLIFRLNPVNYLNLLTLMMLIFGLMFEFPVILVSLEVGNVITPKGLIKAWRWAIIAITIAAGVLTPSGDPFSMMVLMVPLIIFYFGAAGVGKLLGK